MKTVAAVVAVLLLGAAPALAALGESVDSVERDQRRLEGQLRSVALPGYSIHQITREDGLTVKEFVSPRGTVFGVSWAGPAMPDLSQLLGKYYADFQRAAQSRARRRAPIAVRIGDLVVESGGHMRSFRGRAYVDSLVPNTVSAAVVQ
jgi:hypothetical protein